MFKTKEDFQNYIASNVSYLDIVIVNVSSTGDTRHLQLSVTTNKGTIFDCTKNISELFKEEFRLHGVRHVIDVENTSNKKNNNTLLVSDHRSKSEYNTITKLTRSLGVNPMNVRVLPEHNETKENTNKCKTRNKDLKVGQKAFYHFINDICPPCEIVRIDSKGRYVISMKSGYKHIDKEKVHKTLKECLAYAKEVQKEENNK